MPDQRENPEATLILEDLRHFADSLWRNEEIGEKRLQFLITLITAVVAGLVALQTAEAPTPGLDEVTNAALSGLIIFGLVTYFRMLRRNLVADQYQATLKYLRARYLEIAGRTAPYNVPAPIPERWYMRYRGGLADTSAAIISVLTGVLLARLVEPVYIAIGIAVAVLVVLSTLARRE